MVKQSRGPEEEVEYEVIHETKGHWLLTFACPPSKTTPEASTLVHDLFAHLKKLKNKKDGSFIVPMALRHF